MTQLQAVLKIVSIKINAWYVENSASWKQQGQSFTLALHDDKVLCSAASAILQTEQSCCHVK